jgi:hypothetical protein
MLAPSTERHLPEDHRVHGGGALNRADPLWYSHCIESGNNSVVECDLAKVEVAGSNPVSRSILPLLSHRFLRSCRPVGYTNEVLASPLLRVPQSGGTSLGRRRQVVRQRSAKPPSPVQIRAAPPINSTTCGKQAARVGFTSCTSAFMHQRPEYDTLLVLDWVPHRVRSRLFRRTSAHSQHLEPGLSTG